MVGLLSIVPITVIGLLTAVVVITIRLRNPRLTETELFLRFWKVWVALVVLILSAGVMSIYLVIKP